MNDQEHESEFTKEPPDVRTELENWEWGDPPGEFKEAYQRACMIGAGAETLLRAILEDQPYYFSIGTTDDDLTVSIPLLDNFSISGPLNVFDCASQWSEEERLVIIEVLRRIADKLEDSETMHLTSLAWNRRSISETGAPGFIIREFLEWLADTQLIWLAAPGAPGELTECGTPHSDLIARFLKSRALKKGIGNCEGPKSPD